MSLIFCRTNLLVSFIFEDDVFEDEDARVVGYRFDADGKVLESPTPFNGVVRRFLHDAATPIASEFQDDWRGHLVWVVHQINIDFDDIPLTDHIRMDYEVWTPIRDSPIPDWHRHSLPPGPGCAVQ